MVETHKSRLPQKGAVQLGNLRSGNSDFKVNQSAAISSEISMQHEDLQENKEFLQNYLDHAQDEFQETFMRVMFDTGAAVRVCPFLVWRATSTDRDDPEGDFSLWSRHQGPRQEDHSSHAQGPGCCFMSTFLVCDSTAPIIQFTQLLQQGYGFTMGKDNIDVWLEELPCVVLPVYSDNPSMVGPAFVARFSMKSSETKHGLLGTLRRSAQFRDRADTWLYPTICFSRTGSPQMA